MNRIAAVAELLQSPLDVAMISIDRISALTGLLAVEDVAAAFARLSPFEQVAIFGCIEAEVHKAREAVLHAVGCDGGPNARPTGSEATRGSSSVESRAPREGCRQTDS